ncbi:MAG: RDD family protein [Paracoccaceae bacterium]|nr:RDD family protein [Paracoccaceae bacterium]
MTDQSWALPDPDTHPEFYADTVAKRAVAWVADVIAISVLTGIAVVLTAFIGAFFLPLLYATISFLYRWWSLAARSATPGMRLTSLELRTREGQRFDTATAFLHTLGYFLSVAIFPLQLVSIVLMLMSSRKQGLTDHVLGTAAINRAAVS